MILSFSIENFLSFKTKQEVSFHAANVNRSDSPADLVVNDKYNFKVLPVCIVYGTNSAGKTNLISALNDHLKFATISIDQKNGHSLPFRPYKLCEGYHSLPTKFDIDFILADGIRYVYELSYTENKVVSEGLYHYPNKQEALIFERNSQNQFKFGRDYKETLEVISKPTRAEVTFLSTCSKFNTNKSVQSVHKFLLNSSKNDEIGKKYSFELLEKYKSQSNDVLRDVGLGNIDFEIHEEQIPDDIILLNEKMRTAFLEATADSDSAEFHDLPKTIRELKIIRLSESADKVKFDLTTEESQGTKYIVQYLPKIFNVLETGGLLYIDELDESIHTLATQQLVRLFNNKHTNPNGAQLLATVHDTNLLSRNLLRKDQIIFVNKDNGATILNALSDYKTRSTNYESAYLKGHFGAIPNF